MKAADEQNFPKRVLYVQVTRNKTNVRSPLSAVSEYVNLYAGFSLLSAHEQLLPS